MNRGVIYLIINKENGQKYVGQTTIGMNKEWKNHIESAKRMSAEPLHHAMRKYGNHNFMIKELEECSTDLLEERTVYWITQYNTLNSYNGSYVEQEEIEEKNSRNVSEKKKSNWGVFTEKNRGNGKHCGIKIQGLNLDTGEYHTWDNARDAAEAVTGDRSKNSNILLSAKKGYKCYGYRWKLLENKPKKKAVKAIHKVTWQEFHFESCADTVRRVGNGIGATGLKRALRSNGRNTWKGFMWFYLQ